MTTNITRRRFVGAAAGVGTSGLFGGRALAAKGAGGETTQIASISYAYTDPSFAPSGAPYSSLPIENGYFRDEGLDVTIIPISGGMQAAQAVAAGDALFTISGVTTSYQAIAKDPTLRVASFYSSIYQIASPAGSGIRTIADLKGKTIGTQTMTSSAYYFARMLLTNGGLDPDKDVRWLPVGVGSQAAAALRNRDVAAVALWDSVNQIIGGLLGAKMVPVATPLNGLPAMGGFLTREAAIQKEPEKVVGFLRAVYKSYVWAQANPEGAIRLHWKHFPLQRPKNVSQKEALAQGVALLEARLPLVLPKDINGQIGYVDPEIAQGTANLLHENGVLKDKPNIQMMVDQSLSRAANDFSRERVIADAKRWKAE